MQYYSINISQQFMMSSNAKTQNFLASSSSWFLKLHWTWNINVWFVLFRRVRWSLSNVSSTIRDGFCKSNEVTSARSWLYKSYGQWGFHYLVPFFWGSLVEMLIKLPNWLAVVAISPAFMLWNNDHTSLFSFVFFCAWFDLSCSNNSTQHILSDK